MKRVFLGITVALVMVGITLSGSHSSLAVTQVDTARFFVDPATLPFRLRWPERLRAATGGSPTGPAGGSRYRTTGTVTSCCTPTAMRALETSSACRNPGIHRRLA